MTTAPDGWCAAVRVVSSTSFKPEPRRAATEVLAALATMESLRGDEADVQQYVAQKRAMMDELAAVDYDLTRWPPGPTPTVGPGSTIDPIIEIERSISAPCGIVG